MSPSLEQRCRNEIEALHEFFVGWFTGALPESAFEAVFLARFAADLVFIPPAGALLGLDALSSSVRAAHASNEAFRIAIRNVRLQRSFDGFALATYEEWQRNALASTPPDNGRVASVLFATTTPLTWLHIHETWLPPEQMAAGPYDF